MKNKHKSTVQKAQNENPNQNKKKKKKKKKQTCNYKHHINQK
jgi:hypothetical protein